MVYPVFQPVVTAAGKSVKILRKRVLNQIQNNFDHLGLNPPQIYTFIIFLFGLFLPLFFAQWSLPPECLPRSFRQRYSGESGTDLSVICIRDFFRPFRFESIPNLYIYYCVVWPLPPTVYCAAEFPPRMSASFSQTKILGSVGQIFPWSVSEIFFEHLGWNPSQSYIIIIVLFCLFLPLYIAQWSLLPECLPRSVGQRFWGEWHRCFRDLSQRFIRAFRFESIPNLYIYYFLFCLFLPFVIARWSLPPECLLRSFGQGF